MDWLIEEFLGETGVDLRDDRMALQRLKEAAERAKCEVSAAEQAPINLPFISADDSGPRHLSRTLSRQQFEQLVGDLVERTEAPCRDALAQAALAARPDRRGAAGRRADAHPARRRDGLAHLRPRAQPRDQPRRGGGDRRRDPGRHPQAATSRTSSCSTSRRCRWASRPTAACSPSSSTATRPSPPRARRSSPPSSTTRTRWRSTSCRASARSSRRTSRSAASSWSASRRRRAACRRSRSPSPSTPTASSTSRRATWPPTCRRASRSTPPAVSPRTRWSAWSTRRDDHASGRPATAARCAGSRTVSRG